MTWRITTIDMTDGRARISAAVATRDDALRWAGELHAKGIEIVRVKERGGEEISAEGFLAWLHGHQQSPEPLPEA